MLECIWGIFTCSSYRHGSSTWRTHQRRRLLLVFSIWWYKTNEWALFSSNLKLKQPIKFTRALQFLIFPLLPENVPSNSPYGNEIKALPKINHIKLQIGVHVDMWTVFINWASIWTLLMRMKPTLLTISNHRHTSWIG